MNILHLVLGTKNDHYSPIENAAKQTWIKRCPKNIKTIFMYGGSEKKYWDGEDSFYVDRPEDHYNNICLYKTITAFEMFIESNFDYIYRTNNTGYFDLNLVSQFMENKSKKNFYCGHPGVYNNINFASGSSYFLSRDLVEKIIEDQDIIYSYNFPGWCDDVSIGRYVTETLGIEINKEAKRIDLNPQDISDDLDMLHYHYRILNKGDINSIYSIHELKCKNL